LYDQNPECDVAGCKRPATWILLADLADGDSLLCADHMRKLSASNPERACLFGPLSEIVIRHSVPVSSPSDPQ
jgi:hypothetical protein